MLSGLYGQYTANRAIESKTNEEISRNALNNIVVKREESEENNRHTSFNTPGF
jgi:hypothetical protein